VWFSSASPVLRAILSGVKNTTVTCWKREAQVLYSKEFAGEISFSWLAKAEVSANPSHPYRIAKIVPSITIDFTRHLGKKLAAKFGNYPHERVRYVCAACNVCGILCLQK